MTEPVGEGDLIIVIDGDYAMRLPCRKTLEKCDVRAETRLLRSPSETCFPMDRHASAFLRVPRW
jgi:hypothetical protein